MIKLIAQILSQAILIAIYIFIIASEKDFLSGLRYFTWSVLFVIVVLTLIGGGRFSKLKIEKSVLYELVMFRTAIVILIVSLVKNTGSLLWTGVAIVIGSVLIITFIWNYWAALIIKGVQKSNEC